MRNGLLGLDNLPAFGAETFKKFIGWPVAEAEVSPGGAVAVDDDPPFAVIHAFGRTVSQGVHEEQGVARFHMHLDGAGHMLYRILPPRARIELRMAEVRLVASGHHHGGAVAGADIRQGEEDVDLPAVEAAVPVAELGAFHACMPA